jgi:zinc transport system permease protein
MLEMLQYSFILNALLAAIFTGTTGSFYGAFVVQRKMSFLGDGLAHAAFGGIALGLLLQTEPLWIAAPFTILVSIAISFLKEKTKLGADTAIGIFFAVSVALGIVFISLKKDYSVDAFSYLFGSILSVGMGDLIGGVAIFSLTFLAAVKYWKRWAYATFDNELARADKIRVIKDDYALSALLALTIVLSVKLVGIVLVASFLVIPAAAARLVSSTFIKMTVTSIVFGLISSIIGLFASFELDIPSGAAIILAQALIFFVCMFLRINK